MHKINAETVRELLIAEGLMSDDATFEFINKCIAKDRADKEQSDKDTTTRPQTQYVIVLNDPEIQELLKDKELTGWVIKKVPAIKHPDKVNETEPSEWGDLEVEDRITSWIHGMRSNARFKQHKYRCVGDYMEFGNKRQAKEYGLNIVTKLPVFIKPMDLKVPVWTEEGVQITSSCNSLN